MYYSTAHWRTTLNGYSGFAPASYHAVLHYLRDFPSAESLAYLKERGVKYLLVHESFYLVGGFEPDVAALAQSTDVTVAGIFRDSVLGRTYVYELLK
jgi:hypothetical protein